MIQNAAFSLIVNLFLLSFIFSHVVVLCVVDSQFRTCSVPKSCGDGQIIKFPFSIHGGRESFCGFPGFELSCNDNGNPVLQLPDNQYVVRQISYNNQSLRISDAVFNHINKTTTVCRDFPPIQNLTLLEDRFRVLSRGKLFLLYNCNLSSGSRNLEQYKISCDGGNRNGTALTTLALPSEEEEGLALKECGNDAVMVPVVVDESGRGESTRELLSRGFWVKWVASNCSICEESGGKCGFDESTYHFKCFCPDRPHAWRCNTSTGHDYGWKIATCTAAVFFVVIVLFAVFMLPRYRKIKSLSSQLFSRSTSYHSKKLDLEAGRVYFGVPIFSYSELEEATNNFANDKLLGDGGFGTVYHGKLRDGREVAVKRLYEHNYRRVEQFMNEVEILTCLHHKNLVSLYGCTSRHSQELLLVYEFISKGTVADHLHGDQANPSSLTWPTRMNIAIETASALTYLHASDIIHRDVKTTNILLDDNFTVKVADFGLSRLFPSDVTHISTAPQGTPGYVDPQYHQCYQLTDKSDVYSFGVVLVELISSLPPVDITRNRNEVNLSNLAVNKIQNCEFEELIDPNLGYESDEEVRRMTTLVAVLAFKCLQQDPEIRPTMEEVLDELKKIQSGECKLENAETRQDEPQLMKNKEAPPSPPDSDKVALLMKIKFPSSPNSVTEKWFSTDTTPNTSG